MFIVAATAKTFCMHSGTGIHNAARSAFAPLPHKADIVSLPLGRRARAFR